MKLKSVSPLGLVLAQGAGWFHLLAAILLLELFELTL